MFPASTKTWTLAVFRILFKIRSVKIRMMNTSVGLNTFMTVSVRLTHLQGHGRAWKKQWRLYFLVLNARRPDVICYFMFCIQMWRVTCSVPLFCFLKCSPCIPETERPPGISIPWPSRSIGVWKEFAKILLYYFYNVYLLHDEISLFADCSSFLTDGI